MKKNVVRYISPTFLVLAFILVGRIQGAVSEFMNALNSKNEPAMRAALAKYPILNNEGYAKKIKAVWPTFFNVTAPAAGGGAGIGSGGGGGSGPALTRTQGVVDINQTMQDVLASGDVQQVAAVFNALSNQGLAGNALATLQSFKSRITSAFGGTFYMGTKGFDQYNPPGSAIPAPAGPPPPLPPGAPAVVVPVITPLVTTGGTPPPPPPPPGYGPPPPPPPPGVPAAPVVPPYVPFVMKAAKRLNDILRQLKDKNEASVPDNKQYQDILLGMTQVINEKIPAALEFIVAVVQWNDRTVPNLVPNASLANDLQILAAAFAAVPKGKPAPVSGSSVFPPVLTFNVDPADATRCIYSFTPAQENLTTWVKSWGASAVSVPQNPDNPAPQVVVESFGKMLNEFFGLCAVAVQLYVAVAKIQNSDLFKSASEAVELAKLNADKDALEKVISDVKTALGTMITNGLSVGTPPAQIKSDLKAYDETECGSKSQLSKDLTTFSVSVGRFASSRTLFIKEYTDALAAIGDTFAKGLSSKLDGVGEDFENFKSNYSDSCYIPPTLKPGTPPPACVVKKPDPKDGNLWLVQEQNTTLVLDQDPRTGAFDPASIEVYDRTQSPFYVNMLPDCSLPLIGPAQNVPGVSVKMGFLKADYKRTVVTATVDLGEWEVFRVGGVSANAVLNNGKGGYDIYVWAPQLSEAFTVDAAVNADIDLHRIYFTQAEAVKGKKFADRDYFLRLNGNCLFDLGQKKNTRLYKFFSYDSTKYSKQVPGKKKNPSGTYINMPVKVDSSFQKIDNPKNYMEIIYNELMDKLAQNGIMPPSVTALNPGDVIL